MLRLLPLLAFALPAVAQELPADPFAKWEKEIAGIEKRLADKPPAKGGVVFAGSSSIRLWDVKKSFPDLPAANVGFGGSQVRDCTHFADRLVAPLEPKTVVFYAGDNDINAKRTPEQVRDDYRAYVKTVHAKAPKAAILFVAIKPSPSRWKQYEAQSKANALVKEDCDKDDRLKYVDVVTPMLKDGMPRPELFKDDMLHMNEKGYEVWAEVLRPMLK